MRSAPGKRRRGSPSWGDVRTLEELWADGFTVNSPLQQVLPKRRVLELLQSGRIRHSSFAQEIEYIGRHGDVVVLMGNDTVTDPPDGAVSRRRYTNVWRREGGAWRSIARHAHVVSRTSMPCGEHSPGRAWRPNPKVTALEQPAYPPPTP